MYVLTFVDNINIADGPTFVANGIEIIGTSRSVAKLKKDVHKKDLTSDSTVKWEQDGKRWIGRVIYKDEEYKDDQYYVIVKIKELS